MGYINTGRCTDIQTLAREIEKALTTLVIEGGVTTVNVGTVTTNTLAAGNPASVSIMGTQVGDVMTLDFTFDIPVGATGATGAAGATGATGAAGADGSNATVTVGTVTATTIAYGATPTVTITDTDPGDDATLDFDFEIPEGAPGAGTSTIETKVLVRLEVDISGTGAHNATIIAAYGSSGLSTLPGTISSTMSVYNANEFANEGLDGQLWVAEYDYTTTNYELTHQLAPLGILRCRAVGAVTPNTATYSADGLVAVGDGRLPIDGAGTELTSVTVDNTMGIALEDNELHYILHDLEEGSDESDQWIPLAKPIDSTLFEIVVPSVPNP